MQSFLNRPFPCIYGQKANFIAALLIGVFVGGFLLGFKPFGIKVENNAYDILVTAGFGVVSFVIMLFVYFVMPKLYPSFFKEKTYTVGKELIISVIMILLIGLGNSLYAHLMFYNPEGPSILGMIWHTFLIGIFPLSFLTIIQYDRLQKLNTRTSAEIDTKIGQKELLVQELRSPQYYQVSSEQQKTNIDLNELLYLESDGNYVTLHQQKDEAFSKSIHRATLKAIEAENSYPNIIRCHRSYIVNLDQVTEVSGNAQGLRLSIKHHNETVPVSRKYIAEVKNYFN